MGKWVVTVAGIAILSVLCDVILPEGQTRKYVKTVFGVVVSLVIIQPVIGLFSTGVNGDLIDVGEVAPQGQYLSNVANRQSEYDLKTVKQLLELKKIDVKSMNLDASGNKLALTLGVTYSSERNEIVKQVVTAYFPKAGLVVIWSDV